HQCRRIARLPEVGVRLGPVLDLHTGGGPARPCPWIWCETGRPAHYGDEYRFKFFNHISPHARDAAAGGALNLTLAWWRAAGPAWSRAG
ncbi:MAG: hypothetical protein V3R75_05895, partial [Alphaproteobacteria bacterium]